MPDLYIDNLRSNPLSKIIIAGDFGPNNSPDTITAYLRDQIAIGGNNMFNSPNINAAQSALSGTVNTIVDALNAWVGTELAQLRLQHLGQTIQSWTGSGLFTMSIPLVFFARYAGDDIREQAKKVYRTILPSKQNLFTIKAPMGYTVDPLSATAIKGTITIQIGQWFHAITPGYIVRSLNMSWDAAVLKNGIPIVVEGSIEVEPFRMVTVDEFMNYFI